MARCHCPEFFHIPHHISFAKGFWPSQVSSLPFASTSILSFTTQYPGTQLRVFLRIPPYWQHPGWLKHSKAQPWPHGSLSVCSNKPPPWLTLDIVTQQPLGSHSVKMASSLFALLFCSSKTWGILGQYEHITSQVWHLYPLTVGAP